MISRNSVSAHTLFKQKKDVHWKSRDTRDCQRIGTLFFLKYETYNNIPVSDDHHLKCLDNFLQEDICCLYVVIFADLFSNLEELLRRVGKSSVSGK